MPRRPALPKDPSQRAKALLDMATGAAEKPSEPTFSAGQKFAQSGGLKGGKARAEKLSSAKRSEIATRLTQAFSKKVENHVHAFALHTMYHNFVKISGAHRMTPAQAAKVDSRLWEIGDIVKVVEKWEATNA
jgi:hypothetical protein